MLAALRGGIKTVIIPNDNERELSEVPEKIKGKIYKSLITTINDNHYKNTICNMKYLVISRLFSHLSLHL
jgi:ATP-dependent Lon protease